MTQDLVGKNYIVTGSNTGIGKVTALELARRGAHVIMACRSLDKAQPVADEIQRVTGNKNVEVVALDLSSQASVRACAEALLARDLPIHGLINNAGITAGLRGANGLTPDGFEPTFGTNHLGHYLLTRLLLDRIKQTPGGARIVNVSSHSHYMARKIDWNMFQSPPSRTGLPQYEASKLCNVLFTKELAKRLANTGVTVYAVHPGQVATDIWRRLPGPTRWLFKKLMFMLTPEEGAVSSIHTATSASVAGESGLYYDEKGKPKHPSRVAQNPELAAELWAKSAAWVGLPLD
jgi:NAD(P)-dependent dehydrogenase (short-subunit alcohol dehydrogenase family)